MVETEELRKALIGKTIKDVQRIMVISGSPVVGTHLLEFEDGTTLTISPGVFVEEVQEMSLPMKLRYTSCKD